METLRYIFGFVIIILLLGYVLLVILSLILFNSFQRNFFEELWKGTRFLILFSPLIACLLYVLFSTNEKKIDPPK